MLTFLSLVLLSIRPALAQAPEERPAIEGFVTRSASPSDFDVNTVRIICGRNTVSGWSNREEYFGGCPAEAPGFGTRVTVFGKLKKQLDRVDATKIVQHPPAVLGDVSGKAIVDAPPIRNAAGFPAGTIMVRADGYWIVLPFKAKITLVGSINSVEDVSANTWIDYKGRMRPDGVVVASAIKLIPNVVTPSEEKLRKKANYDPAAASTQKQQTTASADVQGVDFRRIRPWPDSAMQSRVSSIGDKLVPQYTLADSAPAKVHFRFEVVDSNWGTDPVPLPDGTIVMPHQAIELMQNDSQIAALLADSIACVLEKQDLRMRFTWGELKGGKVLMYSARTADVLSPGGIAVWAAAKGLGVDPGTELRHQLNQSARVSLTLMHDAGYDISQAPMAWWLIAAGKKPTSETSPPAETVELYRTLATVWSQSAPTPTGKP